MKESKKIFLPPEWYPQSAIMLTWPHKESDWIEIIDEVEECFHQIAREILKYQKLLVIARDPENVKKRLINENTANLTVVHLDSNDSWARDHGPVTLFEDGNPVLLDFQFNGWGLKFPAFHDNQLTSRLFDRKIFNKHTSYRNLLHFVFEGGSFETDGKGTLLTTEKCLLSLNRNQNSAKDDIEAYLKDLFDVDRVLWLKSGFLAGDDTDSHIDTLARFCSEETIAYVKCSNSEDEHFEELAAMELELKKFKKADGSSYQLIALPMVDAIFDKDETRLPATYANFLITNKQVLVPVYGVAQDELAIQLLQEVFPGREVKGIDCNALIKQHGSLHCVTMQLPIGTI